MTRYHNVLKFLGKDIEYEHPGHNMYTIYVMDKGQEINRFYLGLDDDRNNDLNHEDIRKLLGENLK